MKAITLFLLLVLGTSQIFAQKPDVIVKTNGEEMQGKITQISDDEVRFIYQGETAEYILKKSEVARITHSSGRVEEFSSAKASTPSSSGSPLMSGAQNGDVHNKMAVLPFGFIMENQAGGQELSYKVQTEVYSYLSGKMPGYNLLDPRTTNALLRKANVTYENMIDYTIPDLCQILGVEYVIEGTINQHMGVQTTYNSGSYRGDAKNENNKKKVSGSENSYSINEQNYQTTVSVNIMNNKNEQIYNQSHRALLGSTDASYTSPLQYVLKRVPFYQK